MYDNDLSGAIPTELGKLTNLEFLYVLFTPPSFHAVHSRVLPFLSPAHCALSTYYLFSPPGFFVPLIVLVSTFLSSA